MVPFPKCYGPPLSVTKLTLNESAIMNVTKLPVVLDLGGHQFQSKNGLKKFLKVGKQKVGKQMSFILF